MGDERNVFVFGSNMLCSVLDEEARHAVATVAHASAAVLFQEYTVNVHCALFGSVITSFQLTEACK